MRAPKRLPPIPRVLNAAGGAVEVEVVESLAQHAAPDENVLGLYDQTERKISIWAKLKLRERHRTFWHEATHVALNDSGLENGMTIEMQEAVCDAVATMVMRALHG